jgi:hypothetical protein
MKKGIVAPAEHEPGPMSPISDAGDDTGSIPMLCTTPLPAINNVNYVPSPRRARYRAIYNLTIGLLAGCGQVSESYILERTCRKEKGYPIKVMRYISRRYPDKVRLILENGEFYLQVVGGASP